MPTIDSENTAHDLTPASSGGRPALRRLGRLATRTAAAVLAIAAVLLLLLEVDAVLDPVGRWAADRFSPFVDSDLTVGHVSGGLMTGLDVHDVQLRHSSGRTLVSADRVSADIRLMPLLLGRVSLSNVRIERPDVRMTQAADSTWDLAGVLPPADTTGGSTEVTIRNLRLVHGRVTADFYRPEQDSTLRVHDLTVSLDTYTSVPPALAVDSVGVSFSPPGAADTVRASLAGSYRDRVLELARLRLVSAQSNLEAESRLAFPDDKRDFENLDFVLRATPLSFRDLYAFVPGLNPRGIVQGELNVQGSSDLLEVDGAFGFGDGSSLKIRGRASPPSAPRLTYDLALEALRVDLDYLISTTGRSSSPITATLDVDLRGDSPSDLSGTVRLVSEPFAVGRFDVATTRASARLDGGRLDLEAESSVNGTVVSIVGGGRPLDDVPSLTADVDVTGMDVARLQKSSAYGSNVNGSVRVDVQGADLASVRGSAAIVVGPSTWSAVRFRSARSDIRVVDGVFDVTLSGSTEEGRFDGRLQLSLLDEGVSYTIRQLDMRRLNLAALTADTTSSSVTGRIQGSGQGLDLRTAGAQLEVHLDSTHYGKYALLSGQGNFTLEDARVAATGDLQMDGGHLTFNGSARPFDRRPTVDLEHARFDSLDFAELTDAVAWQTRLTGSMSGQALFYDGRASGRFTARLDSSRINDQTVSGAEVDARIDDETLDLEVDVITPGGQIAIEASGRPFGEAPEFEISAGRLTGIDLSKILGMPAVRTDLNGSFTGRVRGSGLETLVGSGHFELDESIVNLDTIQVATLSVSADSGRFSGDSVVRFSRGDARASGFADLRESRTFEVNGTLSRVSPTRLAGLDSLDADVSLDFTVAGRGSATESVTGEVDLTESRIGGIVLESGKARFAFEEGALDVDTLMIRSNVGTVSGGGILVVKAGSSSPTSDLTIHGELEDLGPVSALLPTSGLLLANGTLDLTITGHPSARRVRLDGDLRRIAYGNLRVGEVRLRGVGQLQDGLSLRNGEGRLEAEQPSLPNIAARSARLDIAFREDTLRFEATSVIDDRRDARTSGRVVFGNGDPVLALQTLRFGPPGERWQLLTESEVTLGEEYRISSFLLYSDRQQLAVDGYVDLDGEQSLVVTIEELRIGALANILGYSGLDGRVNGYVDLTGSADAPRIMGSISADLTSLGKPVGDLSVDLDYSDLRIQITANLRDRDAKSLTVNGYIPADLRLSILDQEADERVPRFGGTTSRGETSITVGADGFAIDWIKPFLDPLVYSDIAGRLTGTVQITGTFDQPRLDGTATLAGGRLGLTEFDVTYHGVSLDARFADDQIHIEHAEARSGPGSLIATGSISLNQLNLGDFNIDISTEDFLAVDNRQYRAVAAADLLLTGTTRRPDLKGTIDVASADIYLAEEIEQFQPVKLSTQDLLTVEERFGIRLTERDTTTFVFYEALSMDLTVRMSRNTWLRSRKNPTMDIQFTGSLDVSKQPFQEQQVFGSIEVLPERSKIVQFGKAFEIRKGDLTFNGPVDDPILDLEAEYDISAWRNPDAEVTITLSASGRLDDLDVKLTSDPAMELTDIVSYIALGRPASESLHLGGSGEGGSLATDIALGQVASLIEGVAGSGLGLDVVEIEQQGLDTRLTAGKYVTSRLYLSISQPLSLSGSTSGSTFGNKREITVEFEMLQSLLLRLLSRRGTISVNLLWQHAY